MPLTEAEITPGVVAFFSVQALNSDNQIIKPTAPTTRNGPFVCFETNNNNSAWTPLTKIPREERLEIKKEWRLGGSRSWQTTVHYLNDGATTYTGTNKAFVAAATSADTYEPEKRRYIATDGVEEIRTRIKIRGGSFLSA